MIRSFQVQNYKALRDVKLNLTPIHVLIGPNDSGKTSILEAMEALCRSVDYPLHEAFTGLWNGTDLLWQRREDLQASFSVHIETKDTEEFGYELSCRFANSGRVGVVSKEEFVSQERIELTRPGQSMSAACRLGVGPEHVHKSQHLVLRTIRESISGVQSYRWIPRLLSLPVAPDSSLSFRMESSGFGLARCLDEILGHQRENFDALEHRFRELFPHISAIRLSPVPAFKAQPDDPRRIPTLGESDGKGIYFEMAGGGPRIPATQASDGMLLVLAYLTLLHLPRDHAPRLLLIEEPENGIHPQRLQDVLGILRELVEEQDHTQVVMTTHSPYVVDLFKPEEVTLCHKEEDGSVSVHTLSESETVREQLDVFTLGEIWTAEGDEALSKSQQPGKEAAQ